MPRRRVEPRPCCARLNLCSHERVTEPGHGWRQRGRWYSPPATDTETPESLPLTATTGFKRLGFALLGLLAVGGGLLLAASFLISADTVRQQALSEIRTVTGLNPILRGEATVSLFPSGSVSFADVVLGDAKRPALTAERLTARLRFFPLLIGRVEIADVALERPTIAIDLEPNGQTNWSGPVSYTHLTLPTNREV